MAQLKRLAKIKDNIVKIKYPFFFTEDMNDGRTTDYPKLSPQRFAKKHNRRIFEGIKIKIKGSMKTFLIQVNHCANPFCKWYGLDQKKYEEIKYKPSRYIIVNGRKDEKKLKCNPDPTNSEKGKSLNCYTKIFSNWSLAEEIKRLATNDSVVNINKSYTFHRDDCVNKDKSPFSNTNSFYRRGKSSSNSQKWQCKECKKITNVLPKRQNSFSYHQQRNDILPKFVKLLLNRSPVKRTCEILGIGSQTYYNKLEWTYRRCLEFLERYENKKLKNKKFNSLWINTDKLMYNLNNIRRKGEGGKNYDDIEDTVLQTHIVVSGDIDSNYIFRSDIAYDWYKRYEDIKRDTELYKEDHLYASARKNDRLRFSYVPQPPTANDTESEEEYLRKLEELKIRKKYIKGLHVNSTYTTMAQLWLMKRQLNATKWRFVTDDDNSLITAINRIFTDKIKANSHHFVCHTDKSKDLKTTHKEKIDGRKRLQEWGIAKGHDTSSFKKLGYLKLKKKLENHDFHKVINQDGTKHKEWANNPITHPLPTIDKGFYKVDIKTDVSGYNKDHIANMILKVNDNPTSNFMQQIRRRLSILERPLMTARGKGKSYIYANFNPKYAQYALTILRTYYNFCFQIKGADGTKTTPAQKIGITNKKFSIKDILYFK